MILIKKYSLLITIFIIIVTVVIIIETTQVNQDTIKAVDGYLDLSDYDLTYPIELAGEWELYKDQLLTYEDFKNGNIGKANLQIIPGSFQPNHTSGKKGYGFGTYHLQVKLKNIDNVLGLKILTMSTSYKLMINDKIVASNGIVADNSNDYRSSYRPQAVFFNAGSDTVDIIVQVSNYTYNRTGMWHSMVLGYSNQIINLKEASTRRVVYLIGGILFLLIYHIGIFFMQRKNYKANLYLIFSLTLMLIRIVFTGDYLITTMFPSLSVSFIAWVEYMTIIWAASIIALFNYSLFKEDINIIFVRIIIGVALFNTVLVSILPTNIYTGLINYIEVAYIVAFIYLVWVNYKLFQKGRPYSLLCMLGYSSLIFTCITDALYFKNYINIIEGGFTPYSVFAIVIIQILIVARSYEKSFEDVRTLSKELIKQDKIKDDFLAYTSHEIRNPLHGMISLVENIIENGNNLHNSQKQNLSYAIKSGRRLSSLVDNILDYSKLRNNDLKLNQKDVTLLSIVQFVINTQKYLVYDSNINIICDIDPKTKVYADENRLMQILINLLTNSIKFTKEGYIKICCHEVSDMIEVCVEDTGCGIPGDKLETIFETYQQLDENQALLGTGLGLSISRHLVELHGGKIRVESTVGSGSKFYFTIERGRGTDKQPLLIRTANSKIQLLSSEDFSKIKIYQRGNKESILIVDDDVANLQALINILASENYRVLVTSNSKEALVALSKYKIDMAILDILMDDISGYDLCQQIRQKYTLYHLPVLLLTGQTHTEALIHGFKLGANDFLTKPFSAEELKARVKTLVSMKKSAVEAINNEAAFLQAQIKPHFIYNALNVIVSLCDSDPARASDLLVEFSDYLRKSFDFSNTRRLVALESELEYIKSYLLIEQARFENKIECYFNVQENLGLMIPPLILQPLVENAVKHGILKMQGNGNITIGVVKENSSIVITVEDNGVGMGSQKLQGVLTNEESSKSVGLTNINKRLRHIYGIELIIESELNRGCKVTIKIPANYVKGDKYESNNN